MPVGQPQEQPQIQPMDLGTLMQPMVTQTGGAGGMFPAAGGVSMGAASPFLWPLLIGMGKTVEHNNPGTPAGDTLLGLLGPSAAQIKEDPMGMGLPTALGAPFLAPFFASDKAKGATPEWLSLLGG